MRSLARYGWKSILLTQTSRGGRSYLDMDWVGPGGKPFT